MIAAEMTRIENEIKEGTANPNEIFEYIDARIEDAEKMAYIKAQDELLESEMQGRIEKDKIAAEKARLELKMLALEALERLENVE